MEIKVVGREHEDQKSERSMDADEEGDDESDLDDIN